MTKEKYAILKLDPIRYSEHREKANTIAFQIDKLKAAIKK